MAKNIEIKAKARDWDAQLEAARRRGDHEEILEQKDVFFRCPESAGSESPARLKLRRVNGRSELIAYHRPDHATAKTSDYERCAVEDPEALGRALTKALGAIGVVQKTRTLVMVGQTRIHFDEVEGLGRYLELEVVLREGQSEAEGQAIADELCEYLSITGDDLVEGAYLDHLTCSTK
ncbi:MAG: class IV adenylate cyclase [Planctomycetota bacterium]